MRFLVITEKTSTGFSAYSPDLPGCISTGSTRTEVKKNMRAALQFHLEELLRDHSQVPASLSSASYIEVPEIPAAQ